MAASCMINDPYEPNQLNDHNITRLCSELFNEEVTDNLNYFYNAYHIARFIDADADEKVSPKYDLIRTGLSSHDDSYSFDYNDYTFSKDSLFVPGSSWKVMVNYHKTLTIDVKENNEWNITSMDDGTILKVRLVEETDAGMQTVVSVNGIRTENSSYSARFSAQDMGITFRHTSIGKINSMAYKGEMTIDFYKDASTLKSCTMTLVPGLTTSYQIN